MKKLVSYQCSTCGAIWGTEEQAQHCENMHTGTDAGRTSLIAQLHFPEKSVFPDRLTAKFYAHGKADMCQPLTFVLAPECRAHLGWKTDTINQLPPVGTEIIYRYEHCDYPPRGKTNTYDVPATIVEHLPPEQCEEEEGAWYYPIMVQVAPMDELVETIPYHVRHAVAGNTFRIGRPLSEQLIQWRYL